MVNKMENNEKVIISKKLIKTMIETSKTDIEIYSKAENEYMEGYAKGQVMILEILINHI